MSTERQFYTPPGGPPQGSILPDPHIYERMGEENIFKMLEDFYLELEKSSIRSMFPEDIREASKRSAAFFVSILGGPPLYQEKFGHPRLRHRHMPFKIDEEARLVWLSAFKKTLIDADKKYQFPLEYMAQFCHYLDRFSEWMVNTK
jgi:hemoglobin